jgi:hypothetical protein
MSDKTAVVRETETAYAELQEAVSGLTEEKMGRRWLGTWGVREILTHIAGWHHEMIAALQHVAEGEPPYPPGTYDDFDAWNARFVARRDGVKAAEIITELAASHRGLVTAASGLADEHFAPGATARELIDGVGAQHYREHAAQIREWRQAAS